MPTLQRLLEEHGWIDNFRRLSKDRKLARKGPLFTDSDVYKWIEAVGFALQSGASPELKAAADSTIADIVAIQEPSGYLNSYFTGNLASRRLIPETMENGHELYCLGHLLQGGIAYYRATGDRRLLDAGARFAGYLARDFGPGRKPLLAGHPEIEMALVELYRTTGERRYLDLAGYILGGDKRLNRRAERVSYTFSGIPFTDRKYLEGHSVRAMYASCGATDYYLETGDQRYRETLERLWQDLVRGKMYITGGIGSRWEGEAFGEAYELPNARSYAETCAAIGSMMWNWRMLAATGEARFTDILERTLYNAVNVGVALEGTTYCYRNPLESSGIEQANWQSKDGKIRNSWYDVLCCPPNIQRTLAALPGYFYSTSKDGIYVHLFHNSGLSWQLENGTPIRISQKTRYPWDGDIAFTLEPRKSTEFTFYLRIPGWTSRAAVEVNGRPLAGQARPGTYLPIRRTWKSGDTVRLRLDMTPRLMTANPRVREDAGRVVVERGPLVYCLEGLDQPRDVASLTDAMLAKGSAFREEFQPALLGGIVVLKHDGLVYTTPLANEPLYSLLGSLGRRPARKTELTFIPYHTVANREPSPMMVWVPIEP